MGHCNINDVLKLPNVVEGMKITGNTKLDCNVCTEGKFSKNKRADAKASAPLELVHTDLAGPIEPTSRDGYLGKLNRDGRTEMLFHSQMIFQELCQFTSLKPKVTRP